MNNKIINSSPIQTVAGAALVVSVAGIMSRVLGLFRDRILASKFGAGDTLDIYYAAFRIPDLIYNLLIVGALSAAFIPVFTGLITKKKEKEAWDLSSGLLTLQIITVVALSAILSFFSPYLMKLVTPGFSDDKTAQAAIFTRIMFLSPLLLGMSAIFGGILVSFKRFLVYSLAPIMYNIGIIIGAVFLVDLWGEIGLAWGVVLGAFLHMLLQLQAVKFAGFSFNFVSLKKIISNTHILKVIKLMIPRSLAMGVTQINLLVITIFASTLASGSLSAFNFANNLQSVPLGLFGISFALAAFPKLSSLAAEGDMEKFNHIFMRNFKRILFFVIPASVIIFSLRAEIVRAVLGAGEFDWEDTRITLWILGFLSLSLFAQSTIPLISRAFYALENTKTPFYVALLSEAINISAVIILINKFQVMGLAIAFSLASIVNMLVLFWLLDRYFKGVKKESAFESILKITVSSLLAGLFIYLARHFMANFVELRTLGEVVAQLVIAGGTGLAAYLIACHWLKVDEFYDFRKSILVRTLGKPGDMTEESN
ncbi:MAG: murein biosynthesis integral membrane protein MurJ [Candidatus Moranbacteria bacterium]|nr:murein biosynthesis integral membrane protein MurJ [Candidatus Moranbacteria bacterium]